MVMPPRDKSLLTPKSISSQPEAPDLKRPTGMSRGSDLAREGWEKRFTTDEPRLSEAVENYKELGFEVLLEPVDTSSEECRSCLIAMSDRYRTIYTRRKKE